MFLDGRRTADLFDPRGEAAQEAAAALHDPGGRVTLPLLPGHRGGAEFRGPADPAATSAVPRPGDVWRTVLWREWGPPGAAYSLFVGMNPSTARGDADDPTIRKDIVFTRRMGLTAYRKANVSAYRLTASQDLGAPGLALDCPANLGSVLATARGAALVVMACGAVPRPLRPLAEEMVAALRRAGVALWCLGTTADGSPRHTSRLAYATPLEPWDGWR